MSKQNRRVVDMDSGKRPGERRTRKRRVHQNKYRPDRGES